MGKQINFVADISGCRTCKNVTPQDARFYSWLLLTTAASRHSATQGAELCNSTLMYEILPLLNQVVHSQVLHTICRFVSPSKTFPFTVTVRSNCSNFLRCSRTLLLPIFFAVIFSLYLHHLLSASLTSILGKFNHTEFFHYCVRKTFNNFVYK